MMLQAERTLINKICEGGAGFARGRAGFARGRTGFARGKTE